MTDEPSRPTRRAFLRAGAAAATAGLAASTAGCSSLPPLGSKPKYGRVDVPDTSPPEYRRWLPARGMPDSKRDWALTYAEPGPFDGPVPHEFVVRRAAQKTELDYFGVGYEAYDSLVETNFATVVEAEFAADEVQSTLVDSGYERDGTYRQYDLFSRSDVPRRAAVGDGVIVWTSRRIHDAPDLEATIDAGHGDARRYHETDEAFAAVTEAIGASRQLYVGGDHPGLLPVRAELGADAFRTDGDAAYHVLTERYSSESVPTVDRVKREVEDQRYELISGAETVDVRVDGRLSTVEARVPLAPDRDRDPRYDPPQVTWGASFDADSRTVRLRHEAGEQVDAGWLWYDVRSPSDYGEVERKPLWPDQGAVGPGDEATIDLSGEPDATAVNVEYGTEGVWSERLFTYPLEGAE